MSEEEATATMHPGPPQDVAPQYDKIYAALSKAQSTIKPPERNKEVEVSGKTAAGANYKYKFKYSTLDAIIEAVRAPLTENGLWFVHRVEAKNAQSNAAFLVCELVHSSGQSIRSEAPINMANARHQEVGSAMSYLRRYTLTAVLGIASEEDDDANIADANHVTHTAAPWLGDRKEAAFKKGFRSLNSDIFNCEDMDILLGLFLSDEAKSLVAQCKANLPKWLDGEGDDVGLWARAEGHIETLGGDPVKFWAAVGLDKLRG